MTACTRERASQKREAVAQAAIRLVGTRAPDDFTLVETLIEEIRALPEDEKQPTTVPFYSIEGQAIRRRNERSAVVRAVAFEQLAASCLANERLRHYLRKAGL